MLTLALHELVPAAVVQVPPSTETCTEASPELSDALPAAVMVPESVEPAAGWTKATLGAPLLCFVVPEEGFAANAAPVDATTLTARTPRTTCRIRVLGYTIHSF